LSKAVGDAIINADNFVCSLTFCRKENAVDNTNWSLFRIIVAKFPHINIYTRAAKTTTDLGSVMIATVANKMWGWRVEVINENNYRGPKTKDGLPDHEALQKENPATVVGFCCGLSSMIERVWELSAFYKSQGVTTLAGGWHAHYCPEETLRHNIDLVVHGDGEPVIRGILTNAKMGNPLHYQVPGVSYLFKGISVEGRVYHNDQQAVQIEQIPDMDKSLVALRNEVKDLDDLPDPDFGLLKYVKLKFYPISRTRGCRFNCEFCSVKGGVHSASAYHLFQTVNWLVETRRAKKFFIVDDRLEEDMAGTIEFFHIVKQRYGNRLNFSVQIRLDSAENTEFVKAMVDAGVKTVFVGLESLIDEDLRAIRKGYLSRDMLKWTKILRKNFWVHGMFIFGYPPKNGQSQLTALQMAKRFKTFIAQAKLQSVQVLKAFPIAGTDLRRRLEADGSLFPLELVPWRFYDGNWACFAPKNMSLREFQQIPMKLMNWFYSPFSFVGVFLRLIAFPFLIIRGWRFWKSGWQRDVVKSYGSRLVRKWKTRHNPEKVLQALEKHCREKNL